MDRMGAWGSTTLLSPLIVLSLLSACPSDEGSSNDGSTGSTGSTSSMGSTTTTLGPADDGTTQGGQTGPAGDDTTTSTGLAGTDDTTTGGVVGCGNGLLEPGEDCDDGNGVDSDGCNNDCTISGAVLWSHTHASGDDEHDEAFAVAVDDAGRAYVAGAVGSIDHGFWVRQYTADDEVGWTYLFDEPGTSETARAAAIGGDALHVVGERALPGRATTSGCAASISTAIRGSTCSTTVPPAARTSARAWPSIPAVTWWSRATSSRRSATTPGRASTPPPACRCGPPSTTDPRASAARPTRWPSMGSATWRSRAPTPSMASAARGSRSTTPRALRCGA
ncbi:MAG: hypothetical protein KDK70_04440 [Myxococcales bacterium]|nr:hypothetical protein [Myxococcales bacterium]